MKWPMLVVSMNDGLYWSYVNSKSQFFSIIHMP